MRNSKNRIPLLSMLMTLVMIGALAGITPAFAAPFFFSTGSPDGKIGTFSGPGGGGPVETETADDFFLAQSTRINTATIMGLIPSGASISNVEVELYHIFPVDSDTTRTPNVPTRTNSPADHEIASATRDGSAGTLTFTSTVSSNFSVLNTVVSGINKAPTPPFTGGEGPATGQQVLINITFSTPIVLPGDHYFFRPEVALTSGDFLYLSAPFTAGTFFAPGIPDLQAWIRNANLAPDWLRVGTDITHQGPFNMSFSLTGVTVPEPATLVLLGCGLISLIGLRRKII